MDLPLVMFFVILNILILLPLCMCLHGGISTRTINQPPPSSHSTIPKLILSKEPNSLAPSITILTTNSFQARRQAVRNFSNHRGSIARRGLVPGIANFASNNPSGLSGNSNANLPTSQSDLAAQNFRQVTYPQESQPFPLGDSRPLNNGRSNAPQPRPTPVPIPPVNSSKSKSPSTTSATSLQSQAVTVNSPSPSPTAAATTASPDPPLATNEPAPPSLFQRITSYYKPTHRFGLLTIFITVGLVLGFLVGLMAVLKCVAHRKRFANKKDYPTGFPWKEPQSKSDRNSTQKGLVSTPS